ncbi:MAG: HlyD family efflux transporter periplasmic adaptor subunit [Verrucomicrobia bacterium]|nr:HlyD family efflux transporter periplasmic adaptor subunit [Verrucomicrobiota bacterium]
MSLKSDPKDRLPPIPIPIERKWREFRLRFVPGIVLLATVGAVAFMWSQYVRAPTFQGEAETVESRVSSPHAGTLARIDVSRFQRVSKGEALAVLIPNDPRTQLALLQSQIDILRARMEPRLTGQRNATDYEQLRLEWLLQKIRLASTRVKLARAENELRRDEQMFLEKVVSEDRYDESLKERDRFRTEVQEIEQMTAEMEKTLETLATLGKTETAGSAFAAISAALEAQEQRLRLAESNLGPVTLTAPIDGMVSSIYRQAGENVQNGDPIIALAALESNRIVGYLRQPLSIEPEIGMAVEIRIRSAPPTVRMAAISHVGTQFETVSKALAIQRPAGAADVGLPIEVSLPPGLRIRPGEIVDLVILP